MGTSETFRKFDSDKPMISLVEPNFILGVANVLTFGATKYKRDNWKKGDSEEDVNRIKDSLYRHVLAYMSGEKSDTETGFSHLHHAACNLMFLAYHDGE